jgi:arsenate reductase (glutaredoxin)
MEQITLWHNPDCSKSVRALKIIRDRGWEPEIFLYRSNSPRPEQIWRVLELLKIKPIDLIRKQEPDWIELDIDLRACSDDQIVAAMVAKPQLIQRPIVICDTQGCLGRPVGNIFPLLDQISAKV